MTIRIRFTHYEKVSSEERSMTFYLYHYNIIKIEYLGKPEEQSKVEEKKIKVGVSEHLEDSWFNHGLIKTDLYKVLFEYGKRFVIEKLKDGTLKDFEELELLTSNVEIPCEFDPTRIPNPMEFSEDVKIPEAKLIDTIGENNKKGNSRTDEYIKNILNLAIDIITTRDNINAIFKLKHKENLLSLSQERALMELFRDSENESDFIIRVASFATLVQSINKTLLRSILKNDNNEDGSINLLEKYLRENGYPTNGIIDVLRNIVSLRKLYPIHGDNVDNVIKAHKFFELDYPIKDCSEAWDLIKRKYLESLKKFLEVTKTLYNI